MIRLLKIDLKKLFAYRTFWVLSIAYALLIVSIPVSVLEFLKWLKAKGVDFDTFDPMKIPLLYFPDIWQNITYIYGFLKIFLAIIVIISVSNEFSYKTIRQNVIDGMSRMDFIVSKLLTILIFATVSAVLVFLTGAFTGLSYSTEFSMAEVFEGSTFVLAYFLDVLAYLILAFLFTVIIKRSGLSIALLILYIPLEYIAAGQLTGNLKYLRDYFPLHAINNLIKIPFPRYLFQEIQDYVSIWWVGVVVLYMMIFLTLIYLKLKRSDL